MLRFIELQPGDLRESTLTPQFLAPLVTAGRAGADLAPVVEQLVRSLGFDSFLYSYSPSSRPDREAQLYAFTTLPREWSRIYDDNAYIEVDPRVQMTFDCMAMMIWSGEDFRGRNPRLDRFLDDAARFRIRSGACYTIHNAYNHSVLIAFNSARPRLREAERAMVAGNVGELYAFGTYFHEVFMRAVIERGLPSRLRGAMLTTREIQVLKMVSRGLTADDIARKLELSARTVRHHVDAARTKMGAANREEAIAIAVKAGLFDVLP